ncbi:MAG TPA: YdjY domain-containing protein, partial [Pirellulales bacterium]|nr:YdjY domain-containing protein [Pirellulales bacterium]
KRLSAKYPVWLDAANKRVIVVGQVCLREGQMEMFACLRRTKEHESIVAVPTEAYIVHAALIAAGAEPGNPARFVPAYVPARGTEIGITVYWSDASGKRRKIRAQDWLRNLRTNKLMDQPWVFAGSGFWVDPANGQRHYQAEDGDFICVSNFTSAMLDLPIESSQSNDALMFEANTAEIPPQDTPVTLVLTPKLKELPDDRGDDPKTDLLPLPAQPQPGE